MLLSHLEAIAVIVMSADSGEKEGKNRGGKKKYVPDVFPPLSVEQQRNKILFH